MLKFSTQLPLLQSLRSPLTGRSALWQFQFALNHHRFGSESSQFEQKAKSTPMLLWSLFSVARWQSRWISTRWTKAAGCHTYQACIQTRSCDLNIAAATKQTPTAPRSQHGPCGAKMAFYAIFQYNVLVIDINNTTLGLIWLLRWSF